MHIDSPIITTHSWESSAPIGCIALKSSERSSPTGMVAWHISMRGSVAASAVVGGGEGNITSHVSGARLAGS